MFTSKSKTGNSTTVLTGANTTSLIGAGTTVTGDISCNGDIRIDGELKGNIVSKAKIVIGPAGKVEGDIEGTQADIMGTVKG
ncbi:MAG TPA: polymer-forming cytoskeletal protein, partial [Parasegetibacter sp.]